MNAIARKQAVRRDGDRIRTTVATEQTDQALFDELDSLGKAGSVAKLLFERSRISRPMTACASYAASVSSVMGMPNSRLKPDGWK